MWDHLRSVGYVVNQFGHIDVSKTYYTPSPEQRTAAFIRNRKAAMEKVDKLDDAQLAHIAKLEAQVEQLKLQELLAAAKEAEEAFRAFAQSILNEPGYDGNDASADTALALADKLKKAAAAFGPAKPDPVAQANDEWTKSENETEFQQGDQ